MTDVLGFTLVLHVLGRSNGVRKNIIIHLLPESLSLPLTRGRTKERGDIVRAHNEKAQGEESYICNVDSTPELSLRPFCVPRLVARAEVISLTCTAQAQYSTV